MKTKKKPMIGHAFHLDDSFEGVGALVLSMIEYLQFSYPEPYQDALDRQFPGLFEKAHEIAETFNYAEEGVGLNLSDEDVYTLYTCYDLVGKLMVSDLYDTVIESLSEDAPDPESLKKIYQYSLVKLRPFLQAVELYAQHTGSLPELGAHKQRLNQLPVLS